MKNNLKLFMAIFLIGIATGFGQSTDLSENSMDKLVLEQDNFDIVSMDVDILNLNVPDIGYSLVENNIIALETIYIYIQSNTVDEIKNQPNNNNNKARDRISYITNTLITLTTSEPTIYRSARDGLSC